MNIFDTHAHFDDAAYEEDREQSLLALSIAGVDRICDVSASMESAEAVVALTRQYDFIYGAVGVHPDSVASLTEADMDKLADLSKHEKVVAIGEIGLDYHYQESEPEVQKQWFTRQLSLAEELHMPIIVHSRDAAKDTMDLIMNSGIAKEGGVIHCFSYSKEIAQEYIKKGFYIGIGGVVTFKNARKLKETVAAIPLSAIVLETDCPYMAPEPNRGRRNTSAYLPYVAQTIAQIKGITPEEVCQTTYENALKLFRLV